MVSHIATMQHIGGGCFFVPDRYARNARICVEKFVAKKSDKSDTLPQFHTVKQFHNMKHST